MAEILGIGSPCLDHILPLDPEVLSTLRREPHGRQEIESTRLKEFITLAGPKRISRPGGSACNVVKHLANLGRSCALIGAIGKDPTGESLKENLKKHGVDPLLSLCPTTTAEIACLIAEDGERTFRAVPGASLHLSKQHLNPNYFENAKLVHVEGYTLLNDGLAKESMALAKKSGALISFDLASFEVTKEHRETIHELISEYVDVVFCNELEAKALNHKNSEDVAKELSKHSKIAVVSLGEKGCIVAENGVVTHCKAHAVNAIDCTGAGDLFASAFLHSHLLGKSAQESAMLGNSIASEVIQIAGAELPKEKWRKIKQELNL